MSTNTKTGRRNLRHARIGEPFNNRRHLKVDDVKSRILCIEVQPPEYEEPIDIYFRPIPTSRVFALRGQKEGNALELMFRLLSEFVVDPLTGEPLAVTPEEWDAYGGAQEVIQAMIEVSMGGKNVEAGPTTAASTEAVYQAAKEMMQGDPEMAAAFRRAAEEASSQPELIITESEIETGEDETEERTEPLNGTSDETP